MSGLMITVYYSCALCAVQDCAVKVPARLNAQMDVATWMNETMKQITAHHHHHHPDCIARDLHNLKVPIGGVEWIGGPAIS